MIVRTRIHPAGVGRRQPRRSDSPTGPTPDYGRYSPMRSLASRASRSVGLVILYLAAVAFHSGAAQAHDFSAARATTPSGMRCQALEDADLETIPDAPTHILSAKLVDASADKPAHCVVEGNVAPQVGILMWLPAQAWNGRFLEVGCGGFCGTTSYIANCEQALRTGYACITTDMGHKGIEAEGVEWAYDNPQAVIDFAYRATHVTALAGKAIAQVYYGRKPDTSYFSGCSCGGRQALVEAERFPWDFNGIIVGAPGLNYTDMALNFAQRDRFLTGPDGKRLFDARAIRILGDAVIAKCDMNDGVKDGLIGDPRSCQFDPRDYVCKPGAVSNCLTSAQADAAILFYSEHKSATGDRVGDRAFPPGSETSYLGLADSPIMKRTFYEDFFRYMGLIPNPGPAWKFENFDLDADYKRLGLIQSLLQADDPDFTRFKQAGGKLIFYHGWADGGPSPLTSIAFYQAIERTMGGRAATQDFLRLFMVPGMDHCVGGTGAWSIDFLDYIEKWVEQKKAPDALIGAHYSDDPMEPLAGKALDTSRARFTRPIFPYPLRARYKGSGDPNSASSFKAASAAD